MVFYLYFSINKIFRNVESKKIILRHPPDIIFVYSTRSAQSFIAITKNYSLHTLMTESKVMCISKNVANIFLRSNWKKVELNWMRPSQRRLPRPGFRFNVVYC